MLQKIDPKTLTKNPFTLIGDQWMLITAGTPDHCNTMTASWGGVGIMWGKPVATCYIRPQRYTKQFVDQNDYFTLCFFDETYREKLTYCGSNSGRNADKIEACGFTVKTGAGNVPYFAEAEVVLVCQKQYVQGLQPECMVDPDIDSVFYPEKDYHTMYIGRIVEAYQRG